MAISEEEYLRLCGIYPIFQKVGIKHFEPKIWLIFNALQSGGISQLSVSSKPCQSLMEHNITFDQIGGFLQELYNSEIFSTIDSTTFRVIPKVAYELHRVCYGMTKNIEKFNESFKQLIIECGYQNNSDNRILWTKFDTGDDNAKSGALKDLISQLAYAGARLLIKCILRIEEKVD